ncbi:uncharacterized protein [Rutidosis leptorrhynchoides]|uniref:uncharacterized protein n=1 Tax=Rutidosis leptorrhynchoides TaxID=125765 RepID=UPI003A99CBA7
MTQETWNRFDAIVLQWIYATISKDLLQTILHPDTTAKKAWERLRSIFSDNQNSRALALHNRFTNIKQDNFSSISAYCQEIKSIADQLSNVGDKVSDNRMVLQLVAGLNESYDTIGSRIAHAETLPKFYEARSMLILEESRKNRQASITLDAVDTALVATTNNMEPRETTHSSDRNNNYQTNRGRGGGRNGGRSGRFGNRGRGRNNGFNQGNTNIYPPRQPWAANYWQQPWPMYPPCPYPTTNWNRPNSSNGPTAGLLGPRPQQAYAASVAPSQVSHTPTDIEQALHTMTLNPPEDTWYMDTGASSHMTGSRGFQDGDNSNAM